MYHTSLRNSNFTILNIYSAERVATTVTTGNTGNIATGVANDGHYCIIAPCVIGKTASLRVWVSPSNNQWYLTAIDPNTGNAITNTELQIRYIKLYLYE